RGFDLLIADAQIAVAEGDSTAAAAIDNPQLGATVGRSFDYDARACPGCSATAWSVALTDPYALSDLITGKRGLRADVARAAVGAARRARAGARCRRLFDPLLSCLAGDRPLRGRARARGAGGAALPARRFRAGSSGRGGPRARAQTAHPGRGALCPIHPGGLGSERAA